MGGITAGTYGQPGRRGGRPLVPLGSRRWDPHHCEVVVKTAHTSPYKSRSPKCGWWRSARVVNFEAKHGPVPNGCVVWRLLPICDCDSNLVCISRAVTIRLNQGTWCKPRRPWRTLPLDRELRRTAVLACLAFAEAMRRRENPMVSCGCKCGTTFRKYNASGYARHYAYGHWRRKTAC